MRLPFNRFLSPNEQTSVEIAPFQDPKHAFLGFFLNLCYSNSEFNSLERHISQFVFPEDLTIANFHLVKLYLDLEYHLIVKDPAYIGSKEKLRDLIKSKFPEYANITAFSPLFENGRNQEIALSIQFLHLTLHSLTHNSSCNKIVSRWLYKLKTNTPISSSSSESVKQIYRSRKLIEKSRKIHLELTRVLGEETVKDVFDQKFSEFKSYYYFLKNFNLTKDLLPQSITMDPPLVKSNLTTDYKSFTPTNPKVEDVFQKQILENILDGFVLFNRYGSILDHNKLAVNMFGVSYENLKGKNIIDLLPDDISYQLKNDLDLQQPVFPKNLIGKRIESAIKSKENKTNYFEITTTNNYNEGVDTYSMFIKNINYRKDTLKAIEEAKINAEKVAKTKSTFLSNMSHEIRTPLNVIVGLSELIKNNQQMDRTMLQKNLEGIDFSAKNLLAIVNDILDFSKIEAGKLSIQSIDFNVRKIVTNLADGFEIKSREKGIELLTTINPNVPEIVIGDQYRLNQILNNLIGNAIKFTKEGSIKLSIEIASENDQEITLQFKVEDTGIGIPKEKLQHIFESFYQVEDIHNSKSMGTGLGLAITKQLIDLQNGELTASSTPKVGSIFKFSLPYKKSKLTGIDNARSTYKRKDKQLAGLRVLVAEDNSMNQFYIKQLLSKLSVTVEIAENGKEAVTIFENSKEPYDLIMMDLHMPVMNGIEAIKIIRQSNKNSLKKVPIVACSADVFPEARKEAIKAGIDFYLTKPLSEEAIKEVLFWLISDEDPQNELLDVGTISVSEAKEIKGYVDVSMLMETFDNDIDFIITLLEVFIQSTPEDYKSMRHCMQKEFYPRASTLAHKLKSSFMNLGMTDLGHHLQQIETNTLTTSGLAEAKIHFTAFNKLYTKALREVNILLIDLKKRQKEQ